MKVSVQRGRNGEQGKMNMFSLFYLDVISMTAKLYSDLFPQTDGALLSQTHASDTHRSC